MDESYQKQSLTNYICQFSSKILPKAAQSGNKVLIPLNRKRVLSHQSQYTYLLQGSKNINFSYRVYNLSIFQGQFLPYQYYHGEKSKKLIGHLEDWNQFVLSKASQPLEVRENMLKQGAIFSFIPKAFQHEETLQILKLQLLFTSVYNALKQTTFLPKVKIKEQIQKLFIFFQGQFYKGQGKTKQKISDSSNSKNYAQSNQILSPKFKRFDIKKFTQQEYMRSCSKAEKSSLLSVRRRIKSLCIQSKGKFKKTIQQAQQQIHEEHLKFIFSLNRKRSQQRSKRLMLSLAESKKHTPKKNLIKIKNTMQLENFHSKRKLRLSSVHSKYQIPNKIKIESQKVLENDTSSQNLLKIQDIAGKNMFALEGISNKENKIAKAYKNIFKYPNEKVKYLLKLRPVELKQLKKNRAIDPFFLNN